MYWEQASPARNERATKHNVVSLSSPACAVMFGEEKKKLFLFYLASIVASKILKTYAVINYIFISDV